MKLARAPELGKFLRFMQGETRRERAGELSQMAKEVRTPQRRPMDPPGRQSHERNIPEGTRTTAVAYEHTCRGARQRAQGREKHSRHNLAGRVLVARINKGRR